MAPIEEQYEEIVMETTVSITRSYKIEIIEPTLLSVVTLADDDSTWELIRREVEQDIQFPQDTCAYINIPDRILTICIPDEDFEICLQIWEAFAYKNKGIATARGYSLRLIKEVEPEVVDWEAFY